jgi:DNA-binding transcriptional ArsR family regulator
MASAKTTEFNPTQIQAARIAKALGHPARIAILEILYRRQACVCGALVDELPLSQATVSQHLKEAGLIQGTIDGPRICYCIDPAGWQLAAQLFSSLFLGQTADASCGPTCAC